MQAKAGDSRGQVIALYLVSLFPKTPLRKVSGFVEVRPTDDSSLRDKSSSEISPHSSPPRDGFSFSPCTTFVF